MVAFGRTRALDGVSLRVEPGETLGIVGESGCGKTTLARVVLGLQPLASGEVRVDGRPVKGVARGQAAQVGMVWQDPFASLDPRWKIRDSVAEPQRLAGQVSSVEGLLSQVGLDPSLGDRYPHELSGGQRQRAAIARALALRPGLVILDEPTAALDLSMQAQILNLISELRRSGETSFVFISHDLATVRYLTNRVAVLYLGKVVESGPTEAVFAHPKHPYTSALIAASPSIETIGKLPPPVQGEALLAENKTIGCRYASRCQFRDAVCERQEPEWRGEQSHFAACHFVFPLPGSEDGKSLTKTNSDV